ncbi:hypothetical protein C8R21_10885 [Nitrosospira multiformis]|uniref:Lipoprotein n=1 Tax=Nitrosospira multiformis TaxID=1231 RepID=A0A2T5ICZ9_9PROT|nr:hypothetical protein [Nitrosospira multiformis]PTQ81707.1 hypothetical protein C8R21_10885 [Nitrosospira multiformis]
MKKQITFLVLLLLSGCVSIPPDSFVSTPQLLKQRQIESRRYDGLTEADLITASANVLQDLGYNLENSETKLGVLTASKERDAVNGGEIAAAVAVAILTGVAMPTSKDQTIRVALVVRPVLDSGGKQMIDSHFVRVTFQRLVRKTDNSVYGETLSDPQLYQDFYEKVSKSVFLEGQKL